MRQATADRLAALLAERSEANRRFFAEEADRVADCCRRMAERFAAGGRLIATGSSPADRSDVRHIAVEFVHPVIVGKRALPALGVAPEDVELLAGPEDIVVVFSGEEVSIGDWVFRAPSADPFVRQELVETLYHVLWELVHVFLDLHQRGGPGAGTGASSFLYPFLAEQADDLASVVADVRASVLMKAEEVGELRSQTIEEGREELLAAAADLRDVFAGGGALLALGNGGSATDAMDAVADFRAAGLKAIDLCEDPAILTAIANDIGVEAIFSRQVIAYGREGDALLALSTSGNSGNVILALEEARRRGLRTIAMVGYDGGRVASEQLADHVIVTRSQHIPRIQEAQASAYHCLLGLVEGP